MYSAIEQAGDILCMKAEDLMAEFTVYFDALNSKAFARRVTRPPQDGNRVGLQARRAPSRDRGAWFQPGREYVEGMGTWNS